jgi:hypothetical protein
MSYRELQKQLKFLRKRGVLPKSFRLNQKKNVLLTTLNKHTNKSTRPKTRNKTLKRNIELKSQTLDALNGWESTRYTSNTKTLKGLFMATQKAIKEKKYKGAYITVFMKEKNTNNIKKLGLTRDVHKGITIKKFYTNTYDRFAKRINDILNGNLPGSDRYDGSNYQLVYDKFDIMKTSIVGNGIDDKLLFKCKEFENDGQCWKHVLEDIGLKTNNRDLSRYEDFRNFLIENNSKVLIYTNSFRLDEKRIDNIRKRKEQYFYYEKEKAEIPVRKLKEKDILLNKIHGRIEPWNKPKKNIIFDYENKHYGVCDKIKLDDIYIDDGDDVYKLNDKKQLILIKKAKQLNKTNGKKFEKKMEYIFFDYETIVDWDDHSVMKDYSLSFLVLNNGQLEKLNKLDLQKADKKTINKFVKDKIFNCVKFNSTDMLRDYIVKHQANTVFKLISFNGSNFDNFLLLEHLLKNKSEHWNAKNIFYNGTSLQNFSINGRHTLFDLRKHLVGSLARNCESFKVNSCAKTEFDHHHAQKLYDEGKLLDYMRNNEKLIEYNNYDVISLAILFYRYKQELINMPMTKTYGEKLCDHGTIGSIIYDIFKKHTEKKKYKFASSSRMKNRKLSDYHLTEQEYEDLQKYKIAGRVEMFNGAMEVFEKIVSLDVCSLYPYVLSILNVYYPYGKITRTSTYVKNKIGFYYCDVDQSNLKKNNLPNIYAEKTKTENKWDSDKKLDGYLLSTVMIKLLQDFNCKVDIKHGFYWEQKAKSCDMFGFLTEFMKKKNEQDVLKGKKDEKYNAVLRETLKLLMNSISGKVIEKLHLENTKETSVETYLKLLDSKNIEKITTINIIGDKVFTTFKQTVESRIHTQRPIFLGILCYDYAKDYMYRNCYSIIGLKDLLYTDTDAGKFRDKHMKRFLEHSNKTIVPHWKEIEKIDPRYKTHKLYDPNSKVFGSFENELSDNNYFCCVQKKAWCVYNDDKLVKWGFKGVSPTSLLLDHKLELNNFQLYQYAQDNKAKVLTYKDDDGNTPNIKKLFKRVLNDDEAYVLCQSFRKSVKNSKRASLDEQERFNELNNTISLRLTIKTIKK